ncbi:MAG: arsenate reductase ArsC [Candidatus Aminicenantales bacterium]
MKKPERKRILFICTHNSARSQMAEGLVRSLFGDRIEPASAGTEPSRLHPYAVRVMAEIGIDISRHKAKSLQDFLGEKFDTVVTVCDQAQEACPSFPGARETLHKSFPDPSAAQGSEEGVLEVFRRVRDDIKSWVVEMFGKK